ncbi:MAG: RnfABCDGE type electron transport complex subunit D [Tepidisphaeraceae bacterium]
MSRVDSIVVPNSPAMLHTGNSVGRIASVLLQSLLLMIVGALVVLGWRSLVVVVGVVAMHALARRVWATIANTRVPDWHRPSEWIAPLLVACTLPAEAGTWAANIDGRVVATWAIVPAAALLLSAAQALRRVIWRPRFEPAVLTIVLLHVLIGPSLRPGSIVVRSHAMVGDISTARVEATSTKPWPADDPERVHDEQAVRRDSVAATLDRYLNGKSGDAAQVAPLTLDGLLRDHLPPLDDVVVLGQAAPIGMTSVALLLVAILHACYRGVFDARGPLVAAITCYLIIAALPIPLVIENGVAHRRWLALLASGIEPDVALTFVHYALLGTPVLFAIGVLANLGEVRPLRRWPRLLWSLVLGVLAGVCTILLSTTHGAYVAVLGMGAVAPLFDRLFKPRPAIR